MLPQPVAWAHHSTAWWQLAAVLIQAQALITFSQQTLLTAELCAALGMAAAVAIHGIHSNHAHQVGQYVHPATRAAGSNIPERRLCLAPLVLCLESWTQPLPQLLHRRQRIQTAWFRR
jgi:hypothetical protein